MCSTDDDEHRTLQAATHVENIAEMKARTSYEARIRELEAALLVLEPKHPLLGEVGIPESSTRPA